MSAAQFPAAHPLTWPPPFYPRSIARLAISRNQSFVLQTAGFDARFPNTNQSKHCVSPFAARSLAFSSPLDPDSRIADSIPRPRRASSPTVPELRCTYSAAHWCSGTEDADLTRISKQDYFRCVAAKGEEFPACKQV